MKTPGVVLGLAVAGALLLVACAGSNFERPAVEQFVLGSTTRNQVVARLGEPNAKGTGVSRAGQRLEQMSYIYASTSAESVTMGVAVRRAGFLFHDDVLVGRDFSSSFKSDSTYFDPHKTTSLRQGMSRSEIVALVGQPGGEYGYPIIANRTGVSLVYWFIDSKGAKYRSRILTVELDSNGLMQSYKFYEHVGRTGGTPPPRVWSDDAERAARNAQALQARLDRLRRGMSAEEVRQLLGSGTCGLTLFIDVNDPKLLGGDIRVSASDCFVRFEDRRLAEWGVVVPESVDW
jgi:outer membrane protein assembly factor BamE (lipoprotein component of BamABCDE complex)